jgi:aryl-alcohol dehydrogenase-like predicted oxidoreductase
MGVRTWARAAAQAWRQAPWRSRSGSGETPAQLALAWVLSHPEVTVAITGGDTVEHLENNLGGVGWTLDADVRTELDAVSASLRVILD